MNRFLRKLPTIVSLFIAATVVTLRAEDATVDQLIKKLPPPESVARSAGALDPALRDPLAKQIIDSAKAMNFGNAYVLSQRLVQRYPKSAAAHCLNGELALILRKYSDASSAFHRALTVQPHSALAYVGLGLTDAGQNRVSAAMADFKQVTRISPNAEVGWIGMSACAARMGQGRDSLNYAKRATVIAPRSAAAWLQLSKAQTICGDQAAAAKALARSNELRGSQPTRTTAR